MIKKNKNKTPYSVYVKYSSLGIQMAVLIFFFTWLGTFLDDESNNKTPWWTLGLSLFGVVSGLVLVLKEVMKNSGNE